MRGQPDLSAFSVDRKVFSLDDYALSDLPEYGNCEVGKLEAKATMGNGSTDDARHYMGVQERI